MTDFKPGDVVEHPKFGRGIVTGDGPNPTYVEFVSVMCEPFTAVSRDLRPLVVIDPEDEDHHDRLALALEVTETPNGFDIAAALREFATPTPPRPDEPTGLGAVVEDADGLKWVSVEEMPPFGRWYCGVLPDDDCSIADGAFREWSALSTVRVLSEGIQP